MVIFHCYVSLPEGSHSVDDTICSWTNSSYEPLTRTLGWSSRYSHVSQTAFAASGGGRAGRSSWMFLLKYPNLKVGIYRDIMGTYWDIYCDLYPLLISHSYRKSVFFLWVYLLFWWAIFHSKLWNYQGVYCKIWPEQDSNILGPLGFTWTFLGIVNITIGQTRPSFHHHFKSCSTPTKKDIFRNIAHKSFTQFLWMLATLPSTFLSILPGLFLEPGLCLVFSNFALSLLISKAAFEVQLSNRMMQHERLYLSVQHLNFEI